MAGCEKKVESCISQVKTEAVSVSSFEINLPFKHVYKNRSASTFGKSVE